MITNANAHDVVFRAAHNGLRSGYTTYTDAEKQLLPHIEDSLAALSAVENKDRRTYDLLNIMRRAGDGGKSLWVGIRRDRAMRNAEIVASPAQWTPSDRAKAMLKICENTAHYLTLKTNGSFVSACLQQTIRDLATLSRGEGNNPFQRVHDATTSAIEAERKLWKGSGDVDGEAVAAALRPALSTSERTLRQLTNQLGNV